MTVVFVSMLAPDSDYVEVLNASLTVSGTSTSFGYALSNDNFNEPTEMFQLVLSPGPTGAVDIPVNVATISIIDDDGKLHAITIDWR